MVSLPKLSNCCLYASLKTGTLIIGALNLVGSVICILATICLMAGSTAFIDLMEQQLDQSVPDLRNHIDNDRQGGQIAAWVSEAGILLFGVIMLVCSFFSIVISGCLVHGARTRNVCLMKPWIVLTKIGLILDLVNIVSALWALAFVNAISDILVWVLGAYLFLVVWSFKSEIEEEEGGGGDYQDKVHYKRALRLPQY